jgi:hypothetical protein
MKLNAMHTRKLAAMLMLSKELIQCLDIIFRQLARLLLLRRINRESILLLIIVGVSAARPRHTERHEWLSGQRLPAGQTRKSSEVLSEYIHAG